MSASPHTTRAAAMSAVRAVLPVWLILVTLTAAIGGYAWFAVQELVRQNIAEDLRSVARLQAGQIEQWLSERRDGVTLIASYHFRQAVADWLQNGQAPHTLEHLRDQLRSGEPLRQQRRYRLRALDDGHILLTLPTGAMGLPEAAHDHPAARQQAIAAARQGKVLLDDFHFIGDDPALPVSLGLFVPLRHPVSAAPMAVLQISLSPEDFLYPLLRAWPSSRKTGESLLVRREKAANSTLLRNLSPLRSGAGPFQAPRTLRNDASPLIAQRVLHEGEGFYEEQDYRGVPCLGYGLPIPGTPWLLVAKIDADEAWQPFHTMALTVTSAAAFILLLIAGWLVERQLKEQRLQQAFQEIEDLYQNAPCGYHSLDANGCIQRINDTELALFGYRREDMLGNPISRWMTEATRTRFEQRFQNFVQHQRRTEYHDMEFVRRDGRILPARISATAVRDADGQYLGSRSILMDLSEQRQLESQQRLLQQAIEASFDGFVVVIPDHDRIWRFLYCNPAFARMTGYAREEIIGRTPDFLHGDDVDQTPLAHLKLAVAAGRRFHGVLRNYRKDGSLFWVHVLLDPIFDAQGQLSHYVAIQRDITELRQAQEQLRQLAQHHAQAQEAERQRIARELHDDLGQRLTLLKMHLSLLQSQHDDQPSLFEKTGEMLAIAQGMTSALRSVVRDLRPTALDQGIVGALEWLVEQHGLITGTDCRYEGLRHDPPLDEAIALVLFRVAQEALNNISRHARAQRVTVRLLAGSATLCLSIHDNGCGFDPDHLPAGNHFGLLGMRERVAAIGGQLTIESQPGQGTTITVTLKAPLPHVL